MTVEAVASNMYEALDKFQRDTPPQKLKEVHIVIYQQSMVQSFISALQGCFQGAKPKGLLGKAWNYFAGIHVSLSMCVNLLSLKSLLIWL